MNEKVKHANVLYDQNWLENVFKTNDFIITHVIKGKWRSHDGLDLQDTIVLEKRAYK